MNLKKSLFAVIVAAGAVSAYATPALADLRINVGIGAPRPAPVFYQPAPPPPSAYGYAAARGRWVWHHGRYVWVPVRHRNRGHWRHY